MAVYLRLTETSSKGRRKRCLAGGLHDSSPGPRQSLFLSGLPTTEDTNCLSSFSSWIRGEGLSIHSTAKEYELPIHICSPFSARTPGETWSGQERWCTQWVCITAEQAWAFIIMSSEQICLTFALERDVIFILLDHKQTCFLFQREIPSPSSSCLLVTHPWKHSLEWKLSVLSLQDMQKHEACEDLSLATALLTISSILIDFESFRLSRYSHTCK